MPQYPAADTPTFIHVESADDHVDTDSEASVVDEVGLGGSHESPSQQPIQADVSDCVFLLNDVSMVAHFASECDFDDPSRVCTCDWQGKSTSFKFACGARKAVGDTSITPSECIPASCRICLRAACSEIFD